MEAHSETTMDELLDEAESTDTTPLAAAYRLARRRLQDIAAADMLT